MFVDQCREKMRASMKGKGPKVRGGNGRGCTYPQIVLHSSLLKFIPDVVTEYVVVTKNKPPLPKHFKIDIASPSNKLCIEVDGNSHCPRARKDQDKRKDQFLTGIGYTVLRFSNKRVMANLEECVQEVLFTISKSKETTTTS